MMFSIFFYYKLVFFICFLLIITFLPDTNNLFGFDIILKRFEVGLPGTFSGPLLANNLLSQADHLFKNEIHGPESFASWKRKTYTSLADGRIVEILPDSLRTVAFLDPENAGLEKCGKYFHAVKHCSRPLGLKFSSKGLLYAVDPFHGVYQINVENGEYKLIMDIQKHLYPDGTKARFLDDLVLVEDSKNDDLIIYLTDASERWSLYDVYYTVGEHDQTGKLLSFNPATGRVNILLDHLAFPNGITLNDNKSSILLNEFNKRRILSYHINGNDQGKYSVLASDLPGEPDNIKRSLNSEMETYWVGLFTGRNKHNLNLYLDSMSSQPLLRRSFFRLTRLIGYLIEQFGDLIQNDHITQFGFDIKTSNVMYELVADYGMAIEIDSNGNLINSLHSPDGRTSVLAEVYEYFCDNNERHFYLGSYFNKYLGRLIVNRKQLQSFKTTMLKIEETKSKEFAKVDQHHKSNDHKKLSSDSKESNNQKNEKLPKDDNFKPNEQKLSKGTSKKSQQEQKHHQEL